MKKSALIIIALCVSTLLQAFEIYTPSTVPNPKNQGQDYYISNPDGILSEDAVYYLNKCAKDLYEKTHAELCVVALLHADYAQYTTYDFALELFNLWGIGDKEMNTGVLILLIKGARDIQIITGKGVEGILPDAVCGEIIDKNMAALAAYDFDRGLSNITDEIISRLLTPEAQSELLFGWKAKTTKYVDYVAYYLYVGFLLLIIFACLAYHRLKGKRGVRIEMVREYTMTLQMWLVLFTVFFPLHLLILCIYYARKRKQVEVTPLLCPLCRATMRLVDNDKKADYLSESQLAEDQLKTIEYDVWECTECAHVVRQTYQSRRYGSYSKCPRCDARTLGLVEKKVLLAPTYRSAGLRLEKYCCKHCGYHFEQHATIPLLVQPVSTFGGTGGMSGGSGHGGSFGGGISAGGGAGRHF